MAMEMGWCWSFQTEVPVNMWPGGVETTASSRVFKSGKTLIWSSWSRGVQARVPSGWCLWGRWAELTLEEIINRKRFTPKKLVFEEDL